MSTKDEIEGLIENHMQKIRSLKMAANALADAKNEPLPYPDFETEGDAAGLRVRPDQFYQCTAPATAAKEYLQLRGRQRGPATLDEIYRALVEGGYDKFEGHEESIKRNLQIALGKHRAIRKLPSGQHFGLSAWYPKAKTTSPGAVDAPPDEEDVDAEAGVEESREEAGQDGAVTESGGDIDGHGEGETGRGTA